MIRRGLRPCLLPLLLTIASGLESLDHSAHKHPHLAAAVVVFVSAASGQDVPSCGTSASNPCASLGFAMAQAASASPSGAATLMVDGGRYDNRSCGIVTNLTLSIVGAGAARTIVDCQRAARMLSTTGPAVALSGLTITNGLQVEDPANGVGDGYGGGAVSVVWGWSTTDSEGWPGGSRVDLVGVQFVSNTVLVASSGGDSSLFGGGGAVSVSAGSDGASGVATVADVNVTISSCDFTDNVVLVSASCRGCTVFGGGGALVSLGPGSAVDATVSFADVTATNNALTPNGVLAGR
jgi:hypothetical protein